MHAPFNSLLQVEWVPLAALEALTPAWRDLIGRALEPNVFYEPSFALAAAAELGRGVSVALMWSGSGDGRRLVGLFPGRVARTRHGIPSRILVGWTHPFAPLGTPLVDHELAQPAIAAWLDHAASGALRAQQILLPLVPEAGPFAAALDSVLARSQRRSAAFARHARALLAPTPPDVRYLDHALSGEKRKKLRRQHERLAERGVVQFVAATDPGDVADALASFLALEAGGWKGRAGTAAAQSEATHQFVTRAVVGLAAEHKAAVHRLLLEGRTVAAGIVLRSGSTAWFWKIAYDEALARLSPGTLLAAEVTRTIAAAADLTRGDSCAPPPASPMIDHLWRERLPLCDRLIDARAGGPGFGLACRLEAARRGIVAAARYLRHRLRRR